MVLLDYGHAKQASSEKTPELEEFLAGNIDTRVRLAPDADLDLLAPRLSGLKTIEISFPAFTDGRGFSIARQVRRLGFTGELIAAGGLIPDQYAFALQCGFDKVLVDSDEYERHSKEDWLAALSEFNLTYQRGYAVANGPAQNVFEARKEARAKGVSGDVKKNYNGLSAETALRKAIREDYKGQIVLTSSLGIDSSVLLHMIAQIDADTPILFLETGKHFKETLAYRDQLVEQLGLTNFQNIRPDEAELAILDAKGDLNITDNPACCELRKVRPLNKAASKYKVRITGRKRFQTKDRADINILDLDGDNTRLNPLAFWSAKDVTAYMRKHKLPIHPLLAFGFLSVGCSPCTSKVDEGEDARAGRWRESDKDECGIHFLDGKWVRTKQPPSTDGSYI